MMVVLRRYWVQLTADRRKFAMLCTMLGIALLLWARLVVVSKLPRTAVADTENNVKVTATPPPITEPKPDKQAGAPLRIVLAERPSRDPFLIDEMRFPKPTQVGDLPVDADKSDGQQVEDPIQAEERLRTQLTALVDEFTLDAAMSSASLAVVNGKTYRVGSHIPAIGSEHVRFTLAEVRQRSVILEFEGRRFELTMIEPGG